MSVKPHYLLVQPVVPSPDSRQYHGIDRLFSGQVIDLTEGSATHAIWREELDATEQNEERCIFFDRVDVVRQFQRRYAEHGYELEILAVYPCEEAMDALSVERLPGYLGLDVSSLEPDSALHPAWIWDPVPADSRIEHLAPIWKLEQAYFQPRLNEWGLLTSFADAALLRDVKHALQAIDPRYGEPAGLRILGIVRVGESS